MNKEFPVEKFAASKKGMSLASVLVAAALLGIISLGVSQLFRSSQQNQLALNQRSELERLVNYAKLVSTSRPSCGLDMSSLGEATLRTPAKITLDKIGSNSEITLNYPANSINIKSLELEVSAPFGTGLIADGKIIISAEKKMPSPGGSLRPQEIPVLLELSNDTGALKLKGCSLSSVATDESIELDSKMCELMGRALDNETGLCAENPSEIEAIEYLSRSEALRPGQAVLSCNAMGANGTISEKTCEPNYSEHRINRIPNKDFQHHNELKINPKVFPRKTIIPGVCAFDKATNSWARGKLEIPADHTGEKGTLLDQNKDIYRKPCESVKVANIATTATEAPNYTWTAATALPAKFGSDDSFWKNLDNQEIINRVESCYANETKGLPSNKIACRQELQYRMKNADKVFADTLLNACKYSGGKWQRRINKGWVACKGGVNISNP